MNKKLFNHSERLFRNLNYSMNSKSDSQAKYQGSLEKKAENEDMNVQNRVALEKIKKELQQMRSDDERLMERTHSFISDVTVIGTERKYREFTGNWDPL